jgi:hypothetical protein
MARHASGVGMAAIRSRTGRVRSSSNFLNWPANQEIGVLPRVRLVAI